MALQQLELLPNKTYTFQVLRYLLQQMGIRQGVVGSGDFIASQKAAGANLSVDVAAGGAWVKGTDVARQGLYHEVNDATVNVTGFAAADPTNPRIDQVYLRANDSAIPTGSGDVGTFGIATGTPTAGATLDNRNGVTALPNSCMPICDALVGATATTIVNANIRDRRPPSTFLGVNIPTTETRTNVAYGKMPTADQVANVEVGANEILVVGYQATWQESVATAARAAIFIGANQLKTQKGGVATPQTEAAMIQSGGPNVDTALFSFIAGLACTEASLWSEVATGETVGGITSAGVGGSAVELGGAAFSLATSSPIGGFCNIMGLPAGTYDISVQFKSSSGTVTVKNRKLWVGVLGAQ